MSTAIGLRSERGPVLLALMVATALVAMDTTMISPAIIAITDDIGGFASFPWLFSIYLLTSAVSVPVYAKLADTIGRKPVILVGISVFLIGSLLCGIAWSMPVLIIFRALQGLGGGAIIPLANTILGDIYSVAERARVQAYIAGVWAVSSVIGPSIGGIFAQLDAWRWIFYMNMPLGGFALWLVVNRYREQQSKQRHRIDVLGAVLLTTALALLVLGVLEGGHAWPWFSAPSAAIFGGGLVAMVAFVLAERHAAEPVLSMTALRRPFVTPTVVLNFGAGASIIGMSAFVPNFLQLGAGATPVVAGLALATFSLGWPVAAALGGRLYLRNGFRATTILGATIVVIAVSALVFVAQTPSPITVAATCLFIGAGFGFSTVASLVAAQSAVGRYERGQVTGVILFSRSLGQAIGAAALGAVANGIIAAHGGDETDPATIIAATTTVFVCIAGVSVVVLIATLFMPRKHTIYDDAADAEDSADDADAADNADDAPEIGL